MALVANRYHHGFLPYGSDDPDVIGYASLTSASDTSIGAYAATATGNVTYTDAGVQVGATQVDGSTFTYANALVLLIKREGHVTFEIEKGFFDFDLAEDVNALLILFPGSNTWHVRKGAGDKYIYFANGGLGAQKAGVDNKGVTGTHMRVDISWNNYGVQMYVENMLVMSNPWGNLPGFASIINITGNGGGSGNTEYRIRNLQFSSRPITLPVTHEKNVITVIGDSFTKQGQYPLSFFAYLGEQVEDYGDTTIQATNTHKNRGMIPVIHGELAKKGIHVGERIRWHGRAQIQRSYQLLPSH